MDSSLKKYIKEYIINCIDKTIYYRQTSLKYTKSKFKVGYTPKSFQNYINEEKGYVVNIDYIKEVFDEIYNIIKYEPSEEKRKILLESI